MSTSRRAGQLFDPAIQILWVWDFDRTLFNTGRFTADLMAFLGTLPKVKQHVAGLKDQAANTELFDPFQLLVGLGFSHEELFERFRAYAEDRYGQDHTYLYTDVVATITRIGGTPGVHQAILTTGKLETQRFKLAFCPQLGLLPQAVLQENKGQLLEGCFLPSGQLRYDGLIYDGLVLADDKSSSIAPIGMRASFRGVHVLRPDARYTSKTGRKGEDVEEVAALDELPNLLSGWLAWQQRAS